MDTPIKCLNGDLQPGDLVISTPEDDYPCLVGTVLSIGKLGTSELSGNTKDYVFVDFMHPEYTQNRLQEIEEMLGDAYGRPTTPGIWPLDIDNLPMSPDSLIRITGISKVLQDAILDSGNAAEALCKLVQDSPAVLKEAAQETADRPLVSEKLYSPLEFFLRDKEDAENGHYDEIDYWRDELSHEEAFGYMSQIEDALDKDRQFYSTPRGLAEYIPNSIDDIIVSLHPSIELHGDKLWCVADIKASREISPGEMGELTQWWSGQLSDGWGESFEQHEIKVDRGDLYVEPWSPDDSFFIDTQREFTKRLGLSPAEAALVEPDIFDDSGTSALRETLIERLDDNFAEYVNSICRLDGQELSGMSSEIGAKADAHHYLTEIHNFHTSELEYLLRFQNPLEIVADQFELESEIEDHSAVMWDIFDKQEALQGDYALMSEPTDSDALRKTLFDKFDQNYHDNMDSFRTLMANPNIQNIDVVTMSGRISSLDEAIGYLVDQYDFSDSELKMLASLEYPLDAIASEWVYIDDHIDIETAMREFLKNGRIEDKPLIVAHSDNQRSKACLESTSAPLEPESVMAKIRSQASEPKEPRTDKKPPDKHSPEL